MTTSILHRREHWLRGMGWLLLANFSSTAVTAAVGVLIIRLLGPADFGTYSLIVVAVGLTAAVTTFRLDMHLVAELPGVVQETEGVDSNSELFRRVVRASYLLTLPVSLVAASFIMSTFSGSQRLTYLVGVLEVFLSPWLLCRAVLQVQMRQRAIAGAAIAGRLAWLLSVGVIFFAHLSRPLFWIVVGRVAALIVESILVIRSSHVSISLPSYLKVWNFRPEIAVLRASAPLVISGLGGTLYNRIDQPILAALRGRVETGIYAAGVRLAELPSVIPAIVQSVSQPLMVRLHRERDEEGLATAVSDSLLLMLIPGGFVIALLAGNGEALARLLFGDEFRGTGLVIVLLALAEVGVFVGATFSSVALALNRRRILVSSTVIGLGVNLTVNLLLIPSQGAVGAAWGSLLGYGAAGLCLAIGDKNVRRYARRPLLLTIRSLLPILAAAFAGNLLQDSLVKGLALTALTYAFMVLLVLRGEALAMLTWARDAFLPRRGESASG